MILGILFYGIMMLYPMSAYQYECYQMRLPLIIKRLVEKYIADGEASSAKEINHGLCEGFACDIQDLFGEVEILGVEELMVGVDGNPSGNEKFDWGSLRTVWDLAPPGGLSRKEIDDMTIGGHFWIYHNGKHYDAESPEGVKNLFELPYFQRQINSQLESTNQKCNPGPSADEDYPSP